MDKLGLTPADFAVYRRTMHEPHARRIDLDILSLADGRHLRSLTPKFLDGQVTYDVSGDVKRMLGLTFVDEKQGVGFEPDDPSAAPIHRSRVIKVHDSRFIPDLGDWISCGVFTGPIWDFSRTGPEVTITAHGMERQALGNLGQAHTFPAKSKVTDAIAWLLAAVGDVHANVPDLPKTLPHAVTVHPMSVAWPHIVHLAASLDRYVFYDGYGRFQIRPHHQRATYRFHKTLMDRVTVGRTTDGIINKVIIVGHKPKGLKKRPRGVAVLDGSLSPSDLNHNGAPLYLIHREVRRHVKTNADCQAIANRVLLEIAHVHTDVTFPVMPEPFHEELDMVSVVDAAFGTAHLRMKQWVLPLTPGDAGGSDGPVMTVGSTKRVTRA